MEDLIKLLAIIIYEMEDKTNEKTKKNVWKFLRRDMAINNIFCLFQPNSKLDSKCNSNDNMGISNIYQKNEGGIKMFVSKKKYLRLQEENELIKTENELYEEKYKEKNEALLEIYRLVNTYKKQKIYGEASYREIFRQINEVLENNTQKKLSDEIFPYYTSNS